jgi:hypothetical protein
VFGVKSQYVKDQAEHTGIEAAEGRFEKVSTVLTDTHPKKITDPD